VGGRVRGKAVERFHALALARDRAAARLLVGGHDHVDEPLEEVALRILAGAPRLLERFVRLEEGPGARQRQAAFV
jgi:hypothetical protein